MVSPLGSPWSGVHCSGAYTGLGGRTAPRRWFRREPASRHRGRSRPRRRSGTIEAGGGFDNSQGAVRPVMAVECEAADGQAIPAHHALPSASSACICSAHFTTCRNRSRLYNVPAATEVVMSLDKALLSPLSSWYSGPLGGTGLPLTRGPDRSHDPLLAQHPGSSRGSLCRVQKPVAVEFAVWLRVDVADVVAARSVQPMPPEAVLAIEARNTGVCRLSDDWVVADVKREAAPEQCCGGRASPCF